MKYFYPHHMKITLPSSHIFNRIEFWIFIFFLIRLIGITNPPLEVSHSWRQVTGLMVARNFLELDANILYPRIDETNGASGIIGMEFPSLNYLYFLVSQIFGYTHWYGRLLNLVVSSVGLLFFYKLIVLAGFTARTAFVSTILLSVSIWFTFSRKMMPDTYCISLMFISIYCGIQYLKTHRVSFVLLYSVIASLAVLSKIPAGIYFVCIIPFLFVSHYTLRAKSILVFATIPPLIVTYLWYFVWNVHLATEYGNWYNIGKPFLIGCTEIKDNFGATLENFYSNAFSSYIIFSLFLVGFVYMCIKKDKRLLLAFFLPFLLFVLYICKSGFFFYHHNYYIIPFVPVMALVAGHALSLVQRKWLFLSILILGAGEAIANKQHDLFIKKSQMYKMSLESIMDSVSQPDDLIMINGNGNPQLLYLSHRKGWNCYTEQLLDTVFVQTAVDKGCVFIVIHKPASVQLPSFYSSYIKRFKDDNFLIFEVY